MGLLAIQHDLPIHFYVVFFGVVIGISALIGSRLASWIKPRKRQ